MDSIEATRRELYRALESVPKSVTMSVFEQAMESHLEALRAEDARKQMIISQAGEALREKVAKVISANTEREPQWSDAPDWAEWKAQDAQGNWFWYEKKPSVVGGGWYAPGQQRMAVSHHGVWVSTLEGRP